VASALDISTSAGLDAEAAVVFVLSSASPTPGLIGLLTALATLALNPALLPGFILLGLLFLIPPLVGFALPASGTPIENNTGPASSGFTGGAYVVFAAALAAVGLSPPLILAIFILSKTSFTLTSPSTPPTGLAGEVRRLILPAGVAALVGVVPMLNAMPSMGTAKMLGGAAAAVAAAAGMGGVEGAAAGALRAALCWGVGGVGSVKWNCAAAGSIVGLNAKVLAEGRGGGVSYMSHVKCHMPCAPKNKRVPHTCAPKDNRLCVSQSHAQEFHTKPHTLSQTLP